jgi:hypothetical protein
VTVSEIAVAAARNSRHGGGGDSRRQTTFFRLTVAVACASSPRAGALSLSTAAVAERSTRVSAPAGDAARGRCRAPARSDLVRRDRALPSPQRPLR